MYLNYLCSKYNKWNLWLTVTLDVFKSKNYSLLFYENGD